MSPTLELRIGMTVSLTGRHWRQARQALDGLRTWAAWIDQQGGFRMGDLVRRVRVIYYDDEDRADLARENVARLLDKDRVHALFGPYSSFLTEAVAPVAEERGRILWSHGSGCDNLYRYGRRSVVSVSTPASRYLTDLPAWLEKEAPELRTICVVYEAQGSYAFEIADGLLETAMGRASHQTSMMPAGALSQHIGSLVRELGARRPQVVVLAAAFDDEVQLLRTRADWPDSVKKVVAVAGGFRDLREELERSVEGIVGPSQWEPELRFPEVLGPDSDWFVAHFEERFRRPPDYPAAAAVAAATIFAECVGRTGTFRDAALREAADALDAHTLFGRFRIDDRGQQIGHRVLLVEWRGGSKTVVAGAPQAAVC
jgi:branched-chain amino acid transport system substrate-binding protein